MLTTRTPPWPKPNKQVEHNKQSFQTTDDVIRADLVLAETCFVCHSLLYVFDPQRQQLSNGETLHALAGLCMHADWGLISAYAKLAEFTMKCKSLHHTNVQLSQLMFSLYLGILAGSSLNDTANTLSLFVAAISMLCPLVTLLLIFHSIGFQRRSSF